MNRRYLLLLPILGACAKKNVERYQLKGEVLSLDEKSKLAQIKHEKIDGWMEAMTMEFPVPNEKDFETLAKGRKVWATVYSRESDLEYWIGEVREEGGEVSKPHAPL